MIRRRSSPAPGHLAAFAGALLGLATIVAACGSGGTDHVPGADAPFATDRAAAAKRIADWVRERPGAPLRASVAFPTVLTDSTILRLLARYRVAPYLAHAWAGGVVDYAQVAPESPSVEVLAEARRSIIDHLLRAVCGVGGSREARERDDAALRISPERRDLAAREMLARAESQREALPRVRAGDPVVWGVYVIGAPDDVARLGDDPLVWGFEPAEIVSESGVESVAVPRPPEPEPVGRLVVGPEVAALSAREVQARLERLTADRPAACDAPTVGDPLAAGRWVVAARAVGRTILARARDRRGGAGDGRSGAPPPTPPAPEILVYSPVEGGVRPAEAEVIPVILPGIDPARARPVAVGRISLDGLPIFFGLPGAGPPLLMSPADPTFAVFEEANAIWSLDRSGVVRRLTADRVGGFDYASLAARQREGEVILYWASTPVWSPDGALIAYITNRESVAQGDQGQAVWALELESGRERPLLQEPGRSFRPVGWLGPELVYIGSETGVWSVDPATGARRQLASGVMLDAAPDGSAIAVAEGVPDATVVRVISREGPITVPPAPANFTFSAQAVFSPDGRKLLLQAAAEAGVVRRFFVFDLRTAQLSAIELGDPLLDDWPAWIDNETLLVSWTDRDTRELRASTLRVP